jgi:hypothetical protein
VDKAVGSSAFGGMFGDLAKGFDSPKDAGESFDTQVRNRVDSATKKIDDGILHKHKKHDESSQ